MRNVHGALLALPLALFAAACGGSPTEPGCAPACAAGFSCVSGVCVRGAGGANSSGGGTGGATGGGSAGGGAGGSGGSGTGGGSGSSAFPGLGCDVAAVLASKCVTCHGSPLAGGAPYPLLTRDDLVRASPIDATQTLAQRSVTRMRATVSPMPPLSNPPAATPQDIAAFEAWISRGTPVETCGAPPDAGTPPPNDGGAIIPPPGDGGVAPTTCTSGVYWLLGDLGSGYMNPGKACRSCHQTRAASKLYQFMGTVYPALHEKDLCSSNASGVTVEILDGAGTVQASFTTNLDGNFYGNASGAVRLPYTARVTRNGQVSAMNTPQVSGDCNACHTEQGAMGAPGRLLAP